ncbi:glycolipid transfer protein domain-containing protein [Amylostereum chailletii]|nr:glycolipid transfer protein domain-containing protein [Amylostereum chailletii]
MAPYLDTVTSFADVPITDAGVDTLAFLKASEGVVGLFDLLGSAAFTVVQTDIKGNIAKVRARYDAAPTLSATLEKLVENEKGEKKRTATEGLLWLLRGLSFTCKALQNAQANKSEELAAAFSKSYDGTLKQFHNFVVKGIFAVRFLPSPPTSLHRTPYRADFFAKLRADPNGGPEASEDALNAALDKWLTALAAIVARVEGFYAAGGYGKGF